MFTQMLINTSFQDVFQVINTLTQLLLKHHGVDGTSWWQQSNDILFCFFNWSHVGISNSQWVEKGMLDFHTIVSVIQDEALVVGSICVSILGLFSLRSGSISFQAMAMIFSSAMMGVGLDELG
jgi:hypothetical protein